MSVEEINNIISDCKSHNLQYIDDWNRNALQYLELTNVTFKRYNYPLFKEGISSMDIHQGALGNCYLLAALSALTRDPYLIEKLFYKVGMEYGVIGVWFYYNNQWNMVIVDTQIPCKYNYPIFSYTNGEYWVMLIEKAWAKLNGNYYNTIGGTTKDMLHYLTNGVSCIYDLVDDEIETQYENGSLWKTILEKYKNGSLLTCGGLKEHLVENLTGEIDPSMIDDSNGGLIDSHAYSICWRVVVILIRPPPHPSRAHPRSSAAAPDARKTSTRGAANEIPMHKGSFSCAQFTLPSQPPASLAMALAMPKVPPLGWV